MPAFCDKGSDFMSRFKDPAVLDKFLFLGKLTNVSWNAVVVIDVDF